VNGSAVLFSARRRAFSPFRKTSMSCSSRRPSRPAERSARIPLRRIVRLIWRDGLTVLSPVTSENAFTFGASTAASRAG
jgi:hypothetical protein